MGTKQHFLLFENVSGYSLFLVKEFDEVIRTFSAHVNSFLKPIAFVPFNSLTDALENVQSINDGHVSSLLLHFLRQNVPLKDAVLGVADQELGQSILALDLGFECIWDASIRELLRIVRSNSSRLLRSLIVQPGAPCDSKKGTTAAKETVPGRQAETRARLVVSLSRARLQLDLLHHLADTGVVKSLSLIDTMDTSLTTCMKRLRSAYSLHFPELCRSGGLPGLDDYAFVSIVAHLPLRCELAQHPHRILEWTGQNHSITDEIVSLAKSSIGQDITTDDLRTLQSFATFLLKLLDSRTHCCDMLDRRVRSLMPNLTALMDRALPGSCAQAGDLLTSPPTLHRARRVGDSISSVFVVARLLSHAVNLDRLAKMPSSRINSLGASKSLFRQSGAVAATSTGLIGRTVAPSTSSDPPNDGALSCLTQSIVEQSGGRLRSIVVRRRVARLLAAKSTLACRADCYRRMNPYQTENGDVPVVSYQGQLDSGQYGSNLGDETKRQLKVWAEANGVQFDRTIQELESQKANRKKYRKAKRKAWFHRKTSVRPPPQPVSGPKIGPEALLAHVTPASPELSEVDEATGIQPTAPVANRKRSAPSESIDDDEVVQNGHASDGISRKRGASSLSISGDDEPIVKDPKPSIHGEQQQQNTPKSAKKRKVTATPTSKRRKSLRSASKI